MPSRLLLLVFLGLLGLLAPRRAPAQTPRPTPPAVLSPAAPPVVLPADSSVRCGAYSYLSFLIYDSESGPEPIVAEGVGGTLVLRPDGRYEQRLRIGVPPQVNVFERSGEYQLLGGQGIRLRYLTKQGQPRTDAGIYRYDAQSGGLVITIEGFPAGSRSVYTLVAQPAADPAPAAPGK